MTAIVGTSRHNGHSFQSPAGVPAISSMSLVNADDGWPEDVDSAIAPAKSSEVHVSCTCSKIRYG